MIGKLLLCQVIRRPQNLVSNTREGQNQLALPNRRYEDNDWFRVADSYAAYKLQGFNESCERKTSCFSGGSMRNRAGRMSSERLSPWTR